MMNAIELFRSVVSEKRFAQGSWHYYSHVQGKHYLCLAAAWGKPGTINSTSDCPAGLFPRWVFELMPTLDDGIAKDQVEWLFQGFADRADKMAALSPDEWKTVRVDFLCGVIDIAVQHAGSRQPTPYPDYWLKVTSACSDVQKALKDNGNLEAAGWAAEVAARAAARVAAEVAARAAARAAARVAAEAAARVAAEAGWAAAYKEISSLFFLCIDQVTR
jgi:hypothetical protein